MARTTVAPLRIARSQERGPRQQLWSTAVALPRDYTLLLIGEGVSEVGDWVQVVAQGWLLLTLTNSPFLLGLLGACYTAPHFVFALVSGVYTDRCDRRRSLQMSLVLSTTVACGLASLIFFDGLQVWHLLIGGLLLGASAASRVPVVQSLVPDLVPHEAVMRANVLRYGVSQGTRMLGPLVGSGLVALVGFSGAFLFNGLTFVVALVTILSLQIPAHHRSTQQEAISTQFWQGFYYITSEPRLKQLLVLAALPTLFVLPLGAILPVYAREVLQVDSQGLGILLAVPGVGALIGLTLLVSTPGLGTSSGNLQLSRIPWVLILCSIAMGGCLVMLADTVNIRCAIVPLAVLGFIGIFYRSLINTCFLILPPRELRGRALGYVNLIASLQPLGDIGMGGLATLLGVRAAVLTFGVGLLLVSVVMVKRSALSGSPTTCP